MICNIVDKMKEYNSPINMIVANKINWESSTKLESEERIYKLVKTEENKYKMELMNDKFSTNSFIIFETQCSD